jgi:hypothetical protein
MPEVKYSEPFMRSELIYHIIDAVDVEIIHAAKVI